MLALIAAFAGAPSAIAADPLASPGPSPAPAEGPRSLPADLVPQLADARDIRPRAYADGCHAKAGDTRARACSYGDTEAPYSMLLIGDSHAVQWLPALEAIADREGWRLYSLTKSACPVPDTTVIVRGKRLRDCDAWRKAAFERIGELQPDLVVAASLGRIYELPRGRTPERRERLWLDAWAESLATLRERAGRVVLLGDTPMWPRDPVDCLREHPDDIGRCDTPRAEAASALTEDTERAAAAAAGVAYVPTLDMVCLGDPCHAVEGSTLVLVDTQHMTVAWAQAIAPLLLERLSCDVRPVPGAPSTSPIPEMTAGASPGLSCPR
jgi:hypothetical protein